MREELSLLLQTLESELRGQGRWDDQPPSPVALRSTEPFAVDTLDFDQWLQWILLPKMYQLLLKQLPLPSTCAIQPMAEEVYRNDADGARITRILAEIDTLLTDRQGRLH